MGKRKTARKLAMQALYQSDIAQVSVEEAIDELSERESYLVETVDFARRLAVNTWAEKDAIDKMIADLSRNWTMDRMGKVIVCVLRLAIYELLHERDTPKSVVINEAVELAKKFSTDEASKFVNGILGAFIKGQDKCLRE